MTVVKLLDQTVEETLGSSVLESLIHNERKVEDETVSEFIYYIGRMVKRHLLGPMHHPQR